MDVMESTKELNPVAYDLAHVEVALVTPEQRIARDERLLDAELYWTESHLAELFCDIFASYVCGPAHYVSFVDLALRMSYDPFEVVGDPHPPDAARERVCYEALAWDCQHEKLVDVARRAWQAHESSFSANHKFSLRCGDALLTSLVRSATSAIEEELPYLNRYQTPLPSVEQPENWHASTSLQEILNAGAVVLLLCPDHYQQWEASALRACRRLAGSAGQ